ncbi:MAG: hypothetical protein JO252_01255 [Planctomycetaceae bacterium]|nr:hypothetical protein [Planctomycetaceae bacterium]
MSAKQRRKPQGLRRESRRPRGWVRWYRDGFLDAQADAGGGVRLRTTLWGIPKV